ncbi:hypothetical protein V2G26_017104 [Clonostachys chloroleuca]
MSTPKGWASSQVIIWPFKLPGCLGSAIHAYIASQSRFEYPGRALLITHSAIRCCPRTPPVRFTMEQTGWVLSEQLAVKDA